MSVVVVVSLLSPTYLIHEALSTWFSGRKVYLDGKTGLAEMDDGGMRLKKNFV